ncbi:hypothetical protein IAU59_005979 [Kwoniella sp. CBS 9459]
MHNQNNYPFDKSLSDIFDFDPHLTPTPTGAPNADPDNSFLADSPLPSTASTVPVPASPAPAYTALPYRDVEFHLAPILDGKVGDVELETVDGKRFLVHRKLLEAETVFFHIYYGFVPVWRLNAAGPSTHPHSLSTPIHQGHPEGEYQCQASAQAPAQIQAQCAAARPNTTSTASSLNNLLCLPKILASTLSRAPPAHVHHRADAPAAPATPVPSYDEVAPPPPPPKDIVTAPTPTSSPYTWAVPETSHILAAFLSIIYPRGCITSHPNDMLSSLEITGRVVRAALGYQSAKALTVARDRLGVWTESHPVETYAMASFFKFTDLAKLASMRALAIPSAQWPEDAKVLMGRSATAKLVQLQSSRLDGLRTILMTNGLEQDAHSEGCAYSALTGAVWERMTTELMGRIRPESELFELLEVELGSGGTGGCGECLVLLGKSIQRCLYEARALPTTI